MNKSYRIPTLPLPLDLESKEVLKQLNSANKQLALLRGIAHSIPNETILLSTLTLQEAKDSSSIENIVTTQDDLYKADLNLQNTIANAATKEVLNYRSAIQLGYKLVKTNRILTCNMIKQIQQQLVDNHAGFRSVPGTTLKNTFGEIIYTPPQDSATIISLMANLEQFINNPDDSDLDPLIKLAIAHHQFESIHPFYDGNGRTGRIINILMLILYDLLDTPILYLSRYITHNKAEYYSLIQAIRDKNTDNRQEWIAWIMFILKGIELTATDTIKLIQSIVSLMSDYKTKLKTIFANKYKRDLLHNLFKHPYTKIEYLEHDLAISRQTASKYLDKIVDANLLTKLKLGNENYYINNPLYSLFANNEATNYLC